MEGGKRRERTERTNLGIHRRSRPVGSDDSIPILVRLTRVLSFETSVFDVVVL